MTPAAAAVIELLARRGSIDVIEVLAGAALAERALVARLSSYNAGVVAQRVEDLRRFGVVETTPETGDLRLSAHGRRLLGVLDSLDSWVSDGSRARPRRGR